LVVQEVLADFAIQLNNFYLLDISLKSPKKNGGGYLVKLALLVLMESTAK
jgi:hypothetical protein